MKKLLLAFTMMFALATLAQEPAANASADNPRLPQAPSAQGSETVIEEIVVRINNDVITRSELERSRQQLRQELQQRNPAGADQEFSKLEPNVLRDLIDQQLLVQRAKDMGISVDNELVKRLDEIRKSMNLETMEELERAAEQQGVSYEDFKENMRNQLLTQEVIGREVGSRIGAQITNEEVEQFYNEHRKDLEKPEQVRLSEILIAVAQDPANKDAAPDPQSAEQAQQQAQQVLEEIRKGASFEEMAKKHSSGSSAAQGGDLGIFKRGTMSPELEKLTFEMKPGDVSDVIRTKQGFVIIKVTEHTAAGVPPLKSVERQIQEAIYMRKLQPALRTYLTKLREEAYIDIKPGYVDSGASPNQTKPEITSASAESPEKTKKKRKKLLIF